MNKSETIGALAAALAKAQGAMSHASKDATNPHFRSKYADLAAVVEAIREPLANNGLSYSQLCDFTEGGGLVLETVLMHESGEWISGRMHMPVPKMDPQGVGSALTYGKRYSLAAIVGIAADDDDDGEAAHGRGQDKGQQQQKPQSPPPQQPTLSADQEKYFPRVKAALDTLFGTDTAAKKKEIAALTEFKGKDDKMVSGVEDYRKLDGKRLSILCHKLEQTVEAKAKNEGLPA